MLIVYTITDADGLSSSAVVSVPGLERNHPAIDTTKVPVKVRAGEDVSLDIADYVIVRDGRSPRITNAATLRPSAGIDEGMTLSDDRHVHFHAFVGFTGNTQQFDAIAQFFGVFDVAAIQLADAFQVTRIKVYGCAKCQC